VKELREELNLSGSGRFPALEKLRPRKPRPRSNFASRATSAPSCSATCTRSSSRQRAPGDRADGNALLRERINDIAAEVAKLAMQLEGPNSPIEAMLASEAPRPGSRVGQWGRRQRRQPHRHRPPGRNARRTIRALQSHASRARQQGA